MKPSLHAACALALALAAPAGAQPAGAAPPPGGQSASTQSAYAPHAMVAAANPHAVEAGLAILRAGGSAVDAAVAVQAVLGLVEPQSSGLGGGAFMLYYDARTRRVSAYDGRETAPQDTKPDLWLGPDRKPLPFAQAFTSGKATGAPGVVAMLGLAQREHGRLPWRDLFDGARALARDGFLVTPRLAADISGDYPESSVPDAKAYFTKPDGTPYAAGERLRNPAYAALLATLADKGPGVMQGAEVGQEIADKAGQPPQAGTLTLSDIAGYRPLKRAALCRPYRAYLICTPPPPAGGVGVLELMGELERTDIARRSADDPQAWREFAQASRLMYADRDRYIADPAFVTNPVAGLLDPDYLAGRAALIPTLGAAPATPGHPAGAPVGGPDRTREPGGTSDFAIVDAEGNVVSMTTTVNFIFGTGRMVRGFFLNDQLNDFSSQPTEKDGTPAVNAPGPGKRPRSSMSPVIVLDAQGRFVGALGSPGGSAILDYVAKSLVGWLDWRMPLKAAFDLPNMVAKGDMVAVEAGEPPVVVQSLQALGLQVKPNSGEDSGLHGIAAAPGGGYVGAADKRREGVAAGY